MMRNEIETASTLFSASYCSQAFVALLFRCPPHDIQYIKCIHLSVLFVTLIQARRDVECGILSPWMHRIVHDSFIFAFIRPSSLFHIGKSLSGAYLLTSIPGTACTTCIIKLRLFPRLSPASKVVGGSVPTERVTTERTSMQTTPQHTR